MSTNLQSDSNKLRDTTMEIPGIFWKQAVNELGRLRRENKRRLVEDDDYPDVDDVNSALRKINQNNLVEKGSSAPTLFTADELEAIWAANTEFSYEMVAEHTAGDGVFEPSDRSKEMCRRWARVFAEEANYE